MFEAAQTVGTSVGTGYEYVTRSGAYAPPPANAEGAPYALCEAALAANGIDVASENALAVAYAKAVRIKHLSSYDALVVPGYTPLDAVDATPGVHPIARERLMLAASDLQKNVAPLVILSGGNVHPDGTPYNEALEMKTFLIAQGVARERVLIEPCARHSHTNLRNTGRLMMSLGMRRALIVTSADQTMYFSRPRTSSFDGRCISDLGYLVGLLESVDARRTSFVPSGKNFERGRDPLDP